MFIENEDRYIKVFLEKQFGVGLLKRGPEDPHVCFEILSEDDEHWFPNRNSASSYWLEDLAGAMAEANVWILDNCDPDISSLDNRQYGYIFRKES